MEVMRPQINEAIKLKSDVKFDLQYHLKAVKAVAVRRRDGLSVQFFPTVKLLAIGGHTFQMLLPFSTEVYRAIALLF